MILVRNLLQLLNGSKFIIPVLCCFVILGSCSAFKQGTKQKKTDIVIKDKDGTAEKPTEIKTGEEVLKPPVDTAKTKTLNADRRYNIAIIMPFNTSTLYDGSTSDEYDEDELREEKIPKETSQSINFYQGVLYGLKKHEKDGLKLDVHIYDSNKSDYEINRVLQNEKIKEMDLIIGPMFNNTSRLVAAFAKENKIYHVLPFSPSSSITRDNPYHIKINPTIDVHCKNIYNYVTDQYAGENIIVIYRNSYNEIGLSNIFQELAMNANDEMIPPKMMMYDEEDIILDDWLDPESRNIIIIASLSEAFAQSMTRQLHLKSRDFDITVFGMPTWLSSESLNLDYFESLNFHTSQSIWIDEKDRNVKEFKEYFKETVNTEPDHSAYVAFDIGYYFGYLLLNYGKKLSKKLGDEIYHGISTNFNFQPHYSDSRNIQYYENAFVRIVEFENYELKPAYK